MDDKHAFNLMSTITVFLWRKGGEGHVDRERVTISVYVYGHCRDCYAFYEYLVNIFVLFIVEI